MNLTELNKEENYYSNYQKYREFWQNSLQGIDDITISLEKTLLFLETKYHDFDLIYSEILCQIDILSSIYSSNNNLLGKDYLLKLRSMLKNYKKRYTQDGINFNAIHYIHSRIVELRKKSFEQFPRFNHSISLGFPTNEREIPFTNYNQPFKWITFFRNGSWFITNYNEVKIIEFESIKTILRDEHNKLYIKIDDKIHHIKDMFFSSSGDEKKKLNFLIIIKQDNRIECYAATQIGKRILANNEFIAHLLKPYKTISISPGKIRIFGKNHIYL